MVFCPKFYNADTLHAALEKANNGTYDVTKVQPFSRTSGATYYHESLHWVGLTSTYAYPGKFSQPQSLSNARMSYTNPNPSLGQSRRHPQRQTETLQFRRRSGRRQDIQHRRHGARLYEPSPFIPIKRQHS